jgi:hypothetical protein
MAIIYSENESNLEKFLIVVLGWRNMPIWVTLLATQLTSPLPGMAAKQYIVAC